MNSAPRISRKFPMTSAQRRIFLQCQIPGGDVAYHLTDVIRIRGPFSLIRLKNTLNIFIKRHETLRTGFRLIDGEFTAEVHDHADFSFTETQGSENQINDIIRDFDQPYDLAVPSLIRVLAIRLGDEDLVLATTFHHMIFDGYSASVLNRENHLLATGQTLAALTHQYSDFVQWQTSFFQTRAYQEQKEFWLSQFQTPPQRLNFPTDFPRLLTRNLAGGSFVRSFSSEDLKAFCRDQGCTMFMVLLTAYYALWSRLTGQEDITIGTVTSAREKGGFQDIIGMLANTLALRQFPTTEKPFSAFLEEVKELSVNGLRYADYPFEHLVNDVPFKESGQQHPFFDLVLTYEKKSRRKLSGSLGFGTAIEALDYIVSSSMFPITIDAFDCESHVELVAEYATDLYRDETIHAVLDAYLNILDQICSTPDIPLGMLQLTNKDATLRLDSYNKTASRLRSGGTFMQLWQNQVSLAPDNPAVISGKVEWSYRQLDEASSDLAQVLSQMGLGKNAVIAVAMERSPDWLASLLSIWKINAVYLPLDVEQPPSRTKFFLEDSGCELVISRRIYMEKIPGQYQVVDLDSLPRQTDDQVEPPAGACEESPAYIFYTSGSTGTPKGVKTGHRALFSHIAGLKKIYDIQPDDNVLQFSSHIFDASLEQVLVTLGYGARLVIPDGGHPPDPASLGRLIEHNQITIAELPPAYLAEFSAWGKPGSMSSLKMLIAGGDTLTPALAETLFHLLAPDTRLMNFYGPTEATMAATVFEVPRQLAPFKQMDSIPLGRPLPNTSIHILSPSGQILPPGLAGEICIDGRRLAEGYVNRPGLTREKFVNIEIGGEKHGVYKTGDMGKWLPGGLLEFLGRRDHQVQLRGYRIELGEIEKVLLDHPGVHGAAVILKDDEQTFMCAFLITREDTSPKTSWADYLGSLLPQYMIPSIFVILDQFPLTPGGKIDRSVLKAMPVEKQVTQMSTLPKDPIEYTLMHLWQEIFGMNAVCPDSDFLELGGHSLGFIRMVAKIHDDFGVDLPVTMLMQSMTIQRLAAFIRSREQVPSHPTLIPVRSGSKGRVLFLIPGTDSNMLCFQGMINRLDKGQACYGLQFPLCKEKNSIHELGKFHAKEIMATAGERKIILVGYSFGGYVAFEIARLLEKRGHDPVELMVVDVPAPLKQNSKVPLVLSQRELLSLAVTWLTGRPEPNNSKGNALDSQSDIQACYRETLGMLQEDNYISKSVTLDQFRHMIGLNRLRIDEFYAYIPQGPINAGLHIVRVTNEINSQKFFQEDGGWNHLCRGPVRVTRMDGDHFSVLKSPGVEKLSGLINRICSNREINSPVFSSFKPPSSLSDP